MFGGDMEYRAIYPGDNVQEIIRLIRLAVIQLEGTYLNSKFTFYFSAEKCNLAKKWIIKKAASEVAKDFPNTNGLALAEAIHILTEEVK